MLTKKSAKELYCMQVIMPFSKRVDLRLRQNNIFTGASFVHSIDVSLPICFLLLTAISFFTVRFYTFMFQVYLLKTVWAGTLNFAPRFQPAMHVDV